MGPFEGQVVVGGFAHDTLELEIVGLAGLNLAPPDIHAASLVTCAEVNLRKLVTASCSHTTAITESAIVIVVVIGISSAAKLAVSLVEFGGVRVFRLVLVVLLGGLGVHEVLPLEDGLVLAARRDEVLLTLGISRESHVRDVL